MNMGKKNALAVAIGLSLAAPMSLQAQELEEILVTGTKRAASLEDAPLAVQVFTETAIQEAGITRPEDFLSLVPNVNFVTSNHEGEFFVNVRGQASVRFAESAVAVVIDGVQLATSNEFNQDFFDIEQIEVLKGPQNALYGRNATAGAIIVNTKPPGDEWSGGVRATMGNWNTMKLMGGVGGPITENLGMRLSASINETDGPFQNKYTGEDVHRGSGKTIRWRTRWTGERTTADVIVGASHYEGGAIAFNAQIAGTYTGGVWIPGPDTDAVHEIPFVNDMPGYNEQRKRNVSLRIVHEFDNMTFESISSYSTIKDDYTAKGLPYADFSNPDNNYGLHDIGTRDLLVPDLWANAFGDLTQRWRDQNEAFIQEFRLTSNDESARLRWQVGVYYQNGEKKRTNINGIYTGAPAIDNWMPNGPDTTNPSVNFDITEFPVKNFSPFANIQYDISESLTLSLAGRWENEEREVATLTPSIANDVAGQPTYNQCVLRTGRDPKDCNDKKEFKQFQPKVTLSYLLPNDMGNVYATYGKGFKSGGFNTIGVRDILVDAAVATGGDPSLIFTQDSYDKETTDAYEIGTKLNMLDGRLRMNAAVFWTDVENAQQFEFFPVGSIQAVSKIDEQEITGWEVDANFIVNDNISLFAGYGYTDAEVTKLEAQPAFEGNVVPYIEEYNFVGGFQANYPLTEGLTLTARGQYMRFGEVWYDSGNLAGSERSPISLLDARLGIAGDAWSVTLWGKNLNNEKYASESVPLLSILNVPYKAPTISYGVDFTYDF